MRNYSSDGTEARLDALFCEYRDACEAPELSANFMPDLWQKIESRQSTVGLFRRMSGWFVAGSAAASATLAVALLMAPASNPISSATYVDALAADHSTEYALYTEPVRAERVADFSVGSIQE